MSERCSDRNNGGLRLRRGAARGASLFARASARASFRAANGALFDALLICLFDSRSEVPLDRIHQHRPPELSDDSTDHLDRDLTLSKNIEMLPETGLIWTVLRATEPG